MTAIIVISCVTGVLVFLGLIKILNRMAPPPPKQTAADVPDIRSGPRFPLRSTFDLQWRDSEGRDRALKAAAVDMSDRGLALKADRPLEVGSLVNVRGEDYKLAGAGWVRHCTRRGRSYLVGLEIKGSLSRG
ncbi:MAG TPA: PilZ domain-containing protein [Bryobacteraceae bacterium]|nr:PilZ domain-containing protein [Bryobacteraceae bacterium]